MTKPESLDRPGLPLSRSDVAAFRLDDDLVLCNEGDGQVFVLNLTGAQIWDLCDGTRSVSDIADTVSNTFRIPLGQAISDVTDLIDALFAAGLLATE